LNKKYRTILIIYDEKNQTIYTIANRNIIFSYFISDYISALVIIL